MTVSYQGKSFPVCCTGCRDEFNDNPEKYVKKAALQSQSGSGKNPVKAATSSKGKDDGSFEADMVSCNYFTTVGVTLATGRGFLAQNAQGNEQPAEQKQPGDAVLAYRAHLARFRLFQCTLPDKEAVLV